jgi:hypothetical protein
MERISLLMAVARAAAALVLLPPLPRLPIMDALIRLLLMELPANNKRMAVTVIKTGLFLGRIAEQPAVAALFHPPPAPPARPLPRLALVPLVIAAAGINSPAAVVIATTKNNKVTAKNSG